MATTTSGYSGQITPTAGSYSPQYVKYSPASFGGTTSQWASLVPQAGGKGAPKGTRRIAGKGGFLAAMVAFGKELQDRTEAIVREAAFAGMVEVVTRTPVKTGRARANWRAGFGKVSTKEVEPPDTGSIDTNAAVATTHAVIACANVIKRFSMDKKSIVIASPVPYIFELDNGSSRQAPAGMTAFGALAARNVLRKGRLIRG